MAQRCEKRSKRRRFKQNAVDFEGFSHIAMVIPIGGVGVPLMGPPPPEVAHRFKVIKVCIIVMMLRLGRSEL